MGVLFDLSLNLFPGRYIRFVAVSAGGVLAVAALTYCAFRLQLNLSAGSLLYLLMVVIVSLSAGFWEATIASLAAVMCLDYFFIPPLFCFNVSDPQNWVSLATFETAALMVSRLSVRVQNQALAGSEAAPLHRKAVRAQPAHPFSGSPADTGFGHRGAHPRSCGRRCRSSLRRRGGADRRHGILHSGN
jgi:hypothetical protein